MATIGSLFRDIYRLRRHAAELRTRSAQGPKQLKLLQDRLAHAEQELKQAQDAVKHLKVQLHQGETTLKGHSSEIKRYEGQLQQIMSKKEFDALHHEIAAVRQKSGELEDTMLNQMAELEERTAQLPALEKIVAEARGELTAYQNSNQERQKVYAEELEKTLKALAEVEAQLPAGEVVQQYQRRVKARGDEALSPMRGRNCAACYTEVTAQTMIELRQEGLVLCKSCDRIIFLPEE